MGESDILNVRTSEDEPTCETGYRNSPGDDGLEEELVCCKNDDIITGEEEPVVIKCLNFPNHT